MPHPSGAHRLEILRRSDLLGSPPESEFDRLTALAQRLVAAPVALVSLVDDERHFVKSAAGLGEPWVSRRELPLTHSFCRHVVESGAPLVITDARAHPLVRASPAIDDLGAVAYAGLPLATADGAVLGTFCVVGPTVRHWSETELETLGALAGAAAALVDARLARHDAREAAAARNAVLEQIPDALVVVDAAWRVTFANRSTGVLLGRAPAALLDRSLWDVLPDTDGSAFARLCRSAAAERQERAAECAVPGLPGWFEARAVPERSGGLWLYLRNVAARRAAEDARHRMDARFRTLVEAVGALAFETDVQGRWTELGPAWTAITGFSVEDSLGRPFADFIRPDDREASLEAFRPLLAERQLAVERELRCLTADGGTRWLRVRARLTTGSDGRSAGAHGTLTDVTSDRALAARLAHLERHDALTGLANRAAFVEQLAQLTKRRQGERAAVLLLGLDGFQSVNAIGGQETGDRVLEIVADRLLQLAGGAATVARLAGDQFAVLVPEAAIEDAALLGERVVTELAAPYAVGERSVQLTASVGLAAIDEDALPDAVLRNAETAMRCAKDAGKGRLERFTQALDAAARERHELAVALRPAIERGELHLAYQPIVELATGRPTGVEALLRWRHPELGPISPMTFIPVAEEIGLIPAIGRWVLREACRAIATLAVALPGPPLTVSVNVSGRQLAEERFPDDVADALDATGLAPERLVLEVTETALVSDQRYARRLLGQLRTLGVRVAIDDFGTGYSSLSYLQQLPMDVLKIDRSFVSDVTHHDGPSLAFVRTIVALGQSLGQRTVAEGIETATQRDALRAVGCGYGQGYLFARPLALPDLEEWLVAQAATPR